MIASIMQPTFIPWTGYFSLIYKSDHFFFLDDVQLEKQSWQTRNQLLLANGPSWISVPVYHKNHDQLILQTEIDDRTRWREKFAKTLELNYRKAPFFKEIEFVSKIINDTSIKTLCELNCKIISDACVQLKLPTKLHYSSQNSSKSSHRSERLINLCSSVDCSTYLSPIGAKEYLLEDEFQKNGKVDLQIFSYRPAPYPQNQKVDFVSHLSFVDVVANLGIEGFKKYLTDSTSIQIETIPS